MRDKSVWQRACGLTRAVVEGVDLDEVDDAVIVSVRPTAGGGASVRAVSAAVSSL